MRHDIVSVFVSFCVLVFVRGFCHVALKIDISTLFTTFFVWKALQFILVLFEIYYRIHLYRRKCDLITFPFYGINYVMLRRDVRVIYWHQKIDYYLIITTVDGDMINFLLVPDESNRMDTLKWAYKRKCKNDLCENNVMFVDRYPEI